MLLITLVPVVWLFIGQVEGRSTTENITTAAVLFLVVQQLLQFIGVVMAKPKATAGNGNGATAGMIELAMRRAVEEVLNRHAQQELDYLREIKETNAEICDGMKQLVRSDNDRRYGAAKGHNV